MNTYYKQGMKNTKIRKQVNDKEKIHGKKCKHIEQNICLHKYLKMKNIRFMHWKNFF